MGVALVIHFERWDFPWHKPTSELGPHGHENPQSWSMTQSLSQEAKTTRSHAILPDFSARDMMRYGCVWKFAVYRYTMLSIPSKLLGLNVGKMMSPAAVDGVPWGTMGVPDIFRHSHSDSSDWNLANIWCSDMKYTKKRTSIDSSDFQTHPYIYIYHQISYNIYIP